jgi:hypothetical protein
MNLSDRNTLEFRNGQSPEKIEVLLRSFFRAEMPDPWPVMKAPVEEPFRQPTAPRRWTGLRSRLALAASVALLVLGSWLFGHTADYSVPPSSLSGDGATASPVRPYQPGFKITPPKSNGNKVGSCPKCND